MAGNSPSTRPHAAPRKRRGSPQRGPLESSWEAVDSNDFTHFHAAFTHRGYRLNCVPARAADGGWRAAVVITRASDGELVANRIFPADLKFSECAAAINHARDWAIRWIDTSSPPL